MPRSTKDQLKAIPVRIRIRLIRDKYRKLAMQIYGYVEEANKGGLNPTETDIIEKFQLKNKRQLYHGASSALLALNMIEKAGEAGRVWALRVVR